MGNSVLGGEEGGGAELQGMWGGRSAYARFKTAVWGGTGRRASQIQPGISQLGTAVWMCACRSRKKIANTVSAFCELCSHLKVSRPSLPVPHLRMSRGDKIGCGGKVVPLPPPPIPESLPCSEKPKAGETKAHPAPRGHNSNDKHPRTMEVLQRYPRGGEMTGFSRALSHP